MRARRRCRSVELDIHEAERLGDVELGGHERRDRPAATVGRHVAADDPRRPGDHRREGGGDGVAAEVAGRVDAHGAGGAGGQRLAQPGVGARAAGADDRHAVRVALGEPEGDLEGGPIGVGHAGPPLVAVVADDPLPADADHDRRNTTPWPPSGYDHEMAPSRLHTR